MKTCLGSVCVALATLVAVPFALAQPFTPDVSTLLLLHGDGNLDGAQGESPASVSGVSYSPGRFSDGISFDAGNEVLFDASANIDAGQGTLEFWLRPSWNGNDGVDRWILQWGVGGGILIGKDGGNFWRIIVNRFGSSGDPERGAGVNVSSEWVAGEWHHCAFTWDSSQVRVFIDGELRDAQNVGFSLPAIADGQFRLGSQGTFALQGLVDELRISDRARSESEVLESYLRGLDVVSLSISPNPVDLLETWRTTPVITATLADLSTVEVPTTALVWSSSDAAIADVDAAGRIEGLSAGTATLTGALGAAADAVVVNVSAPALPPSEPAVPVDLATPAAHALWTMPVVAIRFLPTSDGTNVDSSLANWTGTVADLEARILQFERRVKFMLEEGSRFRGYQNPAARPSLGYRVVKIINLYEEIPQGRPTGGGDFFPDYEQILDRIDAETLVNVEGVKEFWMWG